MLKHVFSTKNMSWQSYWHLIWPWVADSRLLRPDVTGGGANMSLECSTRNVVCRTLRRETLEKPRYNASTKIRWVIFEPTFHQQILETRCKASLLLEMLHCRGVEDRNAGDVAGEPLVILNPIWFNIMPCYCIWHYSRVSYVFVYYSMLYCIIMVYYYCIRIYVDSGNPGQTSKFFFLLLPRQP